MFLGYDQRFSYRQRQIKKNNRGRFNPYYPYACFCFLLSHLDVSA